MLNNRPTNSHSTNQDKGMSSTHPILITPSHSFLGLSIWRNVLFVGLDFAELSRKEKKTFLWFTVLWFLTTSNAKVFGCYDIGLSIASRCLSHEYIMQRKIVEYHTTQHSYGLVSCCMVHCTVHSRRYGYYINKQQSVSRSFCV